MTQFLFQLKVLTDNYIEYNYIEFLNSFMFLMYIKNNTELIFLKIESYFALMIYSSRNKFKN